MAKNFKLVVANGPRSIALFFCLGQLIIVFIIVIKSQFRDHEPSILECLDSLSVDDKYDVLSDGSILIKQCGVIFPRLGSPGETIGFYNVTIDSCSPQLRIQVSDNSVYNGSGYIILPNGERMTVGYYGATWLLSDLEKVTYSLEPNAAGLSLEQKKQLPTMLFKFRFGPRACCGCSVKESINESQ